MDDRSSKGDGFTALAGWLFADLLLGLAMLYFSLGVRVPPMQATPTPSPTPFPPGEPTWTPTPTPSPTPTTTATATPSVQYCLNGEYVTKVLDLGADPRAASTDALRVSLDREVANKFAKEIKDGAYPGVAIVSGGYRGEDANSGVGSGVDRAKRVSIALQSHPFFGRAKGWITDSHGAYASSQAQIVVFFFVPCAL